MKLLDLLRGHESRLSVMKNIRACHDWQVTGGYDAAQDGPDPQWGRVAVECRTCGEKRRVGRQLDLKGDVVTQGCRRHGSDEWQPGDYLVRDGGFLDTFERWLPDGRVQTYNAGGHYHESDRADLRPAG